MVRTRNEIEHEIWVTAYLAALREVLPREAEAQAIDAVRRYQDRWNRLPAVAGLDALSFRDDPPISDEHEEQGEGGFQVLRCPEDYAGDDAEDAMGSNRPNGAVSTSSTFPVSLPVSADKVS